MSIRLTHVIAVVSCSMLMHALAPRDAVLFNTISHTMSIESLYADTHMCFYHGASKDAYIAMLANTYLDHIYNKTPLRDDFVKLRIDSDLYNGPQSLHEYLQLDIDDRGLPYKNELLSVNVSLPGNLYNPTENTLLYFKRNSNDMLDTSLFSYIANAYCDDPHVCRQVIDVMENKLREVSEFPCGVVMQICLPQSIVPSCVYISTGRGIPHYMARRDATYSYNVLEAYRNDQNALRTLLGKEDRNFNAKGLQARIRLDAPIFSQPGSVIIYTYHGMPRNIESELYHSLYHVVSAYTLASFSS